jgi:uncharacterized YccA/Bax inhibitor family protein
VGRIINMLADAANRRDVRQKARECRRSGVTDAMMASVLEIVCGMARDIGDDDATEQYVRVGAASRLELQLPGLDPATILLLVQLVWLVYQALKAIGYFDGDGLKSVTPAAINEHFGGL